VLAGDIPKDVFQGSHTKRLSFLLTFPQGGGLFVLS
jgi:hypothetical protein